MKQRIAKLISVAGHPLLTIPLFVVFVMFSFENIGKAVFISFLIIGCIFIPLIVRLYLKSKNGSYTNFDVTNLQLSNKTFEENMTITVEVKNSGTTAGKEVVELYLSAPAKNLQKPASELKAFAKTKQLLPGEIQKIELAIKAKDLASFDEKASAWVAEAGTYKVLVGTSSLNIKQSETFTLATDKVVEKTHKAFAPDIAFEELKK